MNKIPGHHPMFFSANIETHLQKNKKPLMSSDRKSFENKLFGSTVFENNAKMSSLIFLVFEFSRQNVFYNFTNFGAKIHTF